MKATMRPLGNEMIVKEKKQKHFLSVVWHIPLLLLTSRLLLFLHHVTASYKFGPSLK